MKQFGLPKDLTRSIPFSKHITIGHFPGDPGLQVGYEQELFTPPPGADFILTRAYSTRVSNGIQQWRNGNAGFGLFDGAGGTDQIVGPDEPWDNNDAYWPTDNGLRVKNGMYVRRVRDENEPNGNGQDHERSSFGINGFIVPAEDVTVPVTNRFTPDLVGLDYSDAVGGAVTLLGSGWAPGQSRTIFTVPAGKNLILQSFGMQPGPDATQTTNPDFAELRDPMGSGTYQNIMPWQYLRRGNPIHSAGGILVRNALELYLLPAGAPNTRDHEVSFGGYLIDG